MITSSTPNFTAKEINSARDLYNAQLNKIQQTAQKQTDMVTSNSVNQVKQQIPMQGAGQKLDVIA